MKRVVFNFDESSYAAVQAMQKADGQPDIAAVLRDALSLKRCIDQHVAEGYDVLFHDSDTGDERKMVRECRRVMARRK